jgi:SNF2 family DNA or RNA helicase
VLDEAQRIKNRNGKTAQVVQSIHCRRNWALTGTPIENCTDDLLGIFEFVAPGQLSSGMKPRHLSRAVRDYVLRRTKEEVLDDLPPKLVRDAELHLTPEQHATYERAENEGIVRLTQMGAGVKVTHIFELILRLKQICNFDPTTGASTKLEWLTADLEEIAESGQKAIVFSQWVATLEKLAKKLNRFGPERYHGGIPNKRRDAAIQRFRDDPKCHVMLMSYGAGSVGLNLQFAGYVFLFDRWWNPAVEDQAINRAHRIGATGPVTVTRFVSLSTIEERINQILAEKREIFDTIFGTGQMGPGNLGLTQQEIFGLFDLKVPETQQQRKAA